MLFAGTLEPLRELKEESDEEAMFSSGFGFASELGVGDNDTGFKSTSIEDKVAKVKAVLATKTESEKHSGNASIHPARLAGIQQREGIEAIGSKPSEKEKSTSLKRKSAFEEESQAKKMKSDGKFVPVGVEQGVMFHTLRLSTPLTRAIHSLGWTKTTPIQTKAIPLGLAGRDIVGCAKTGSGKTAAFMLPILERLLNRPNNTRVSRVLILSPTRELATQIYKMGRDLASLTNITFAFAVGGLSIQNQRNTLQSKPDIVVATPGRMIDHLRNSIGIHFEDLEILVLDEADRLLDLGFIDELREICKSLPRERQTMLFSATISPEVTDLTEVAMVNPLNVNVDHGGSVVDSLNQEFIRLRGKLLGKEEAIVMQLCRSRFRVRTMVFGETRKKVRRLKVLMELLNMKCSELHGSLSQPQRMRNLQKFKDGQVNFMVCTDVASRGLDIPNVYAVIQFKFPDIKTYIHRVGRTARAGKNGVALTLFSQDQRSQLKAVKKATKTQKKANIVWHHVNAEKVQKMHEKIVGLEDATKEVFQQENLEKSIQDVEQRTKRLENQMKYKNEILSRPVKTWFCSYEDRQNTRAKYHNSKKQNIALKKKELEQERIRKEREEELMISKRAKKAARPQKQKDTMNRLTYVDEPWKKVCWEKTEENFTREYKIDRIGRHGSQLARKYPEVKVKKNKPKVKKKYKRRHKRKK
jgi:ATP-dependent RNA helicase DDX27